MADDSGCCSEPTPTTPGHRNMRHLTLTLTPPYGLGPASRFPRKLCYRPADLPDTTSGRDRCADTNSGSTTASRQREADKGLDTGGGCARRFPDRPRNRCDQGPLCASAEKSPHSYVRRWFCG